MNAGITREHRSVLLSEAVEALVTQLEGIYVDGTFGRGGHSRAVLARLAPAGRLLAFDKDPEAIAAAGSIADPRFTIHHADFGVFCGDERAALRQKRDQCDLP